MGLKYELYPPICNISLSFFLLFRASPEDKTGVSSYTVEGYHLGGFYYFNSLYKFLALHTHSYFLPYLYIFLIISNPPSL